MSTVRAETRAGGVRLLTLDRPPANALHETLLGDLATALADAERDDAVRAVVLTGAGAFFSGGVDLRAARREADAERDFWVLANRAMTALLAFPKPTVALVGGHAIAGGLVLVLACDYRLGLAGDYRIGLNEVAIGASYPKAAFEIVRLRLTDQRANELLLGAALYPASEGVRLGVVDELLPAEKLADTVFRRAARLGAFPREAYAHTKAALVADACARIRAEAAAEAAEAAAVWHSPESRAARSAQRAKLGGGR